MIAGQIKVITSKMSTLDHLIALNITRMYTLVSECTV